MSYGRNLKIILALVFVATVALVSWSYMRRAYQTYQLLSQPEKLASDVARLAKGFEYTESRDGKPVFKVVASRSVELRHGANILEGVELYKYDDQGRISDAVKSGRAVYHAASKLVEFEQQVELRLSNGITVRSGHLRADLNTQQVEILSGYLFESGRYSGQGPRLYYRMRERELEMQDQAELFVKNGSHVQSYVRSNQVLLMVARNQILLRGSVFCRSGGDTLRADSMDLSYDFEKQQLQEVKATGGVVVEGSTQSGGRTLTAEEIRFPLLGSRATSFDAVGNVKPARLEVRETSTGRSVEAARIEGRLDNDGNISMLNASRDVRFSALPAGPEVQSVLSTATFVEGRLLTAEFSERVHLQDKERGASLRANALSVGFSHAGDAERLEASGAAILDRTAPDGATESQLSADRVQGTLLQGGGFRDITGKGSAVFRLRGLAEKSTRTVSADKVAADFDAAGNLAALTAERNVVVIMESETGIHRTYSDFLECRFAASEISWLKQWPSFRFEDGENTLMGELATYQGGVTTVARQKRDPVLVRSDARTTARSFLLHEKEEKFLGLGDVKAEIHRQGRAGLALPALANDEPVFIQADEVQLLPGQAVYRGRVKIYQKSNFLFAQQVALHSEGSLVASGNVRTIVYRQSKGELKRVDARAPYLEYKRGAGVAAYSGGVRMTTEDGAISAETLDLYFSPSGQIENAVAQQSVLLQQGSRTGEGSRMEYNFSENRITLIGNLAQVVDTAKGRTSGRRLTFFVGDDRVVAEG